MKIKIKDFVLNNAELFTLLSLGIMFFFIFIFNLWGYPLMDVDESRYVLMARDMFNSKDFLTLYLNNEYFFEKPPLYFWLVCLSFGIFGKVTEFTARFPIAMCGILASFMTYFVCKKVYNRIYGIVASLVLATSLEFLILSKFAILDAVLASCVWISLCFGMLTYFVQDKNKKYCWWMFYIFSALAVMAKGIPGFVIPFGSMFFISLYSKNFKSLFKPQYLLVGILLFLTIVLPWHIIMLKIHNPLFYNEYVIKHHLARFLGSEELGRQQPFYFYFLTILWGFFPWILSSLVVFIRKITKKDFNFSGDTNIRKFLVFNSIIAVFTLLFFSSSKTKLITYILPIYSSLACLGGYLWTRYITNGEYKRFINKTTYVIGGIFLLTSLIVIIGQLFLPPELNKDINTVKIICVTILSAFGIFAIYFTKKEKFYAVFFTYVITMAALSGIAMKNIYLLDYKFAQDDLIYIAKYATQNNKSITTYRFGKKYSLNYYGKQPTEFGVGMEEKDLENALNKENNIVIIRHKDFKKLSLNYKYSIVFDGRKYIVLAK